MCKAESYKGLKPLQLLRNEASLQIVREIRILRKDEEHWKKEKLNIQNRSQMR